MAGEVIGRGDRTQVKWPYSRIWNCREQGKLADAIQNRCRGEKMCWLLSFSPPPVPPIVPNFAKSQFARELGKCRPPLRVNSSHIAQGRGTQEWIYILYPENKLPIRTNTDLVKSCFHLYYDYISPQTLTSLALYGLHYS